MTQRLDFSNKNVLVTGGSRGIGRGITQAFLDAGANVVVLARTPPTKEGPGLPTSADGRAAGFVACNVRDAAEVERGVAEATEHLGGLDVLINNAGGSPPSETATASHRFSQAIVELNLLAPLWVSQQAWAVMSTQPGGGAIVNVGSVSALRPSPGTAVYGAAKAGLLNLTRTLGLEWAPQVRVNAVAAGPIRTELAHLHYGDTEAIARVEATIPLGRLGLPADVANGCLFLASPLAEWISGTALVVDGGGESPAFLGAVKGS